MNKAKLQQALGPLEARLTLLETGHNVTAAVGTGTGGGGLGQHVPMPEAVMRRVQALEGQLTQARLRAAQWVVAVPHTRCVCVRARAGSCFGKQDGG